MKLYKKGEQPGGILPETQKTLDKIWDFIDRNGPQDMLTLKMLSCNHKSGDGSNPDRFAPYAIKLGWLVQV